jgi:hypothetical protein
LNLLTDFTSAGLYFGLVEKNHNVAEQFALAMNYGSPGATAIATNSNITRQANHLAAGGERHGGKVMQANDNFTIQVDLALNYNSPGATAIATNSIIIQQANDLTTGYIGQGGKFTQANDNIDIQIDLAININSPNAVSIADNSNISRQFNDLSKSAGPSTGNFVQLNSNHTIQFGFALDINSPGAVAKASNGIEIIQANSVEMLPKGIELMLEDLGVPGFASGMAGAGGSSALDQHHSSFGGLAALLSTSHLMDLTPVYRS